jgi:hypothetical protein
MEAKESVTDGRAGPKAARVVVQCPLSHHGDGLAMDVVGHLNRQFSDVISFFYSRARPAVFLTPDPFDPTSSSVSGQDLVVFVIDCRSAAHARVTVDKLKNRLAELYGTLGQGDVFISAAVFDVERHQWSIP